MEVEELLNLVPPAARGTVAGPSALQQVANALSSPTSRGASQSTLVDILSRAGFAEGSSGSIARYCTALATPAQTATATLALLLCSLACVPHKKAAAGAAASADRAVSTAEASQLRESINKQLALAETHINAVNAEDHRRLQALVASVTAAPTTITGLMKQSCVVGDTKSISIVSDKGLLVENCNGATILVTAAVSRITLRRCRGCTIACAPTNVMVTVEDCSACSITVASPIVSVHNCVACILFVWSHAPVAVSGSSHDIAIGPYNAVGDGLMELETFKRWYIRGDSRFDASAAGLSTCRAILPSEFFWRYLPLPQANNEHIVMPLAFNMATAAPTMPTEGAGLKGGEAQRAEIKVQAAFVKWLVEENKVLPLKNAFR